jgi:hypothetical protein
VGPFLTRKDGSTSTDPTIQRHLAQIRENFHEYVKLTERGYEAKKPIPKDCPIGYFSGRLTKDPPGVFQTVTLGEDKHVLADISDPFEVGCIALMTQKCQNPNCKPFAMKYGLDLIHVPIMYTTRAIRVGELLTVSWVDYYISMEEAYKSKDEYPKHQLKPCRCRLGCPNSYFLDPAESDPFEAYDAAYANHIRSNLGEPAVARVRRSARGSGGVPGDEEAKHDPIRQRLDGRPSRAVQRLDGRQSRVAQIVR